MLMKYSWSHLPSNNAELFINVVYDCPSSAIHPPLSKAILL